jgi:hypothetical protein
MQMIQLRHLLRHLRKANLLHPHLAVACAHVFILCTGAGPYAAETCSTDAAHVVDPAWLPRVLTPDPERLGSGGGRYPYCCQISEFMTARQPQGTPPIRFDPVFPSRPEPASTL